MPGPLAAQLAIYLGYVHYRLRGATAVGIAFVLPSFMMVVVLGWLYVRFGGLTWMQAVLCGVGAAVIGIIALSAYKLTTKHIGRDPLLWAIYLVSAGITAVTASEMIWVFLLAGILVWLARAPPTIRKGSGSLHSLVPLALLPVSAVAFDWPLLGQILGFFMKAVGFIGYPVAGVPGAMVAALGTFLPCYLFTIIPAPYFKKHGKRPAIAAFVNGATAAAVGTIASAIVILGPSIYGPSPSSRRFDREASTRR